MKTTQSPQPIDLKQYSTQRLRYILLALKSDPDPTDKEVEGMRNIEHELEERRYYEEILQQREKLKDLSERLEIQKKRIDEEVKNKSST